MRTITRDATLSPLGEQQGASTAKSAKIYKCSRRVLNGHIDKQ